MKQQDLSDTCDASHQYNMTHSFSLMYTLHSTHIPALRPRTYTFDKECCDPFLKEWVMPLRHSLSSRHPWDGLTRGEMLCRSCLQMTGRLSWSVLLLGCCWSWNQCQCGIEVGRMQTVCLHCWHPGCLPEDVNFRTGALLYGPLLSGQP